MTGIERDQALYRFRTRRRASSLFTDRTGRTCCKVRLAASRPADILCLFFFARNARSFGLLQSIFNNFRLLGAPYHGEFFTKTQPVVTFSAFFIHLNYIMLSSFCYLTDTHLRHEHF